MDYTSKKCIYVQTWSFLCQSVFTDQERNPQRIMYIPVFCHVFPARDLNSELQFFFLSMQGEPVSCVKCGGNGEGQKKTFITGWIFPFV